MVEQCWKLFSQIILLVVVVYTILYISTDFVRHTHISSLNDTTKILVHNMRRYVFNNIKILFCVCACVYCIAVLMVGFIYILNSNL